MTIYVHDTGDGYVEFYVCDGIFKRLEEDFIEHFGQRPKTTYENAYIVMKEIDSWYMDHYSKGLVQFEFD
jgi:hypothetical protein